jgi:predicted adenylyl cyclase CyaB
MREIEILVKVFNRKKEALAKLSKFKKIGVKKTTDSYFYDPLRENLKPMANGKLKKCFRLRNSNNKIFLTYKIDHFNQKGKWTHSDEHEIKLLSKNVVLKIIKHLGFRNLIVVKSKKYVYYHANYEIVLEEVKNAGLFLEVEHKKPSNRSTRAVKNEIWSFIKSLNLKTSKELNMGKPELLLRQKNKKII